MKFVSWNVNGLRAIAQKGFDEIFGSFDADFFCLQETKMQEGQHDFSPAGYVKYFNYAEKKGYSGTAIYARKKPIAVTYGMGLPEHDNEGRIVTLEYEDFFLVCVYTPNAQDELKRLAYRMQWEDAFRTYLLQLDTLKGVIVCGDLNVAHNEIDLKNPKTNHLSAGFSDEERAKFSKLIGSGFIDTFRHLYPTKIQYSWWSYRMNARAKGTGWRIDYFLVSDRLKDRVKDALIHDEVMGSDHCPVSLILD
ncbi:MAG: exodeoxyribonuclease III [Erysipelotrichales bacterium]|nr:MAG: exodeoxyribonuclease III [Erysipelotrichales bacterium]